MVTETNPRHPEKANLPIDFIEFGMVTDVIDVLLRNTESLMLVAVDGIIMLPEASDHALIIPLVITGSANMETNEIHKIKHK